MLNKILLIITFTLISLSAHSQTEVVTAASALKLYSAEKYGEAKIAYNELLKRNNRDYAFNYYYGVSLFHLKENQDEAIQRLKLAATRPPSNDVHYYLGKLYQRVYENDLAITHFQRFLKSAKNDDPKKPDAERAIEDCNASNDLINKHFEINVINKDTVDFADFLNSYHLSQDAGKLMKAGEFFTVGVDQSSIIFRTERGSQVLFPIKSAQNDYDLYKIVRLLDSWTDAELLSGNVNSAYNDLYPFWLIDGVTLYFASDRPGGMGGLDIYQSFLDSETGEFSEPANLGPPFNSPDDDFLLVPDEYEGKAWFTTTRGVPEGKVVVTEILWDNSVIRSFTNDVHQIKTLASLPLSKNLNVQSSTTLFSGNDTPVQKVNSDFKFIINDTIVYTKYSDFKSAEALNLYKSGEEKEQKKDSLQTIMSAKRQQYAKSYDQQELQNLIDEIVRLERQTYSLDDLIQENFLSSRRKELETIQQQLSDGVYTKSGTQKALNTEKSATQLLLENLNKSELTFYSTEAFQKRRRKVEPMYRSLFNEQEVKELLMSDSLYVWANILSLEAAKTIEKTQSPSEENISLTKRILNSDEIEEEETQRIQALITKSREYKLNSLDLYEHALDQKFGIYYPLAEKYGATSNNPNNQDVLNQARTIFRESNDNIKEISGYNPERTERLLALKRMSVEMLENSFQSQMDNNTSQTQKSTTSTGVRFIDNKQPTNIQPLRNSENVAQTETTQAKTVAQQQALTSVSSTTPKPVYKIQIGVFKNEPNRAALEKLPEVTHQAIAGSELKRFFTGNWNSYEEAQAQLSTIREAGFKDAFIVALLNNLLIPIEEARRIQ